MNIAAIGDHRDLVVWQKALALARDVYRATARFPSTEIFRLTAQVRRAAVSVASNVAEGSARGTTADFLYFLHIARGSQAEVDTQLRLARDLEYLPEAEANELLARSEEVGRLLTAVIAALRRRQAR